MLSFLWNEAILNPMVNALLWLYALLGNNFVLALTIFTVLVRLITLPLNIRQQKSMLKTQEMQPQIKAIQDKYRDNPQKMQEEFQKIGYNPAETLSGCLPLIIQMPILIGLYRAIFFLLGSTPQALLELSDRAYDFINLGALLPVDNRFLWLNLGQPDPFYVLPVLVFATMFLQQKLLTPVSQASQKNNSNSNKKSQQPDPTAQMNQTMLYTMPIMFGFLSLQFSAGLSIYWVLANIIGVFQGYYVRQAMAPHREASQARREAIEQNVSSSDDGVKDDNKRKSAKTSDVKSYNGSKADTSTKRRTSKRKRKARR
jgi:YidC/Oxa1 family membrane protein insertase